MEKYYIYLNDKRYMELPKAFNIEHDVYVKSSPGIEITLDNWGAGAVTDWDGSIWVRQNFFESPGWSTILRHELRHTKQMKESDVGRQIFLRKLHSPELVGSKSYIEPFAKEVMRLRTGEELSFKDRYQLFRKLTSPEGRTVHTKHPYEVDAIKWQEKNIPFQYTDELDKYIKEMIRQKNLREQKYGMSQEELIARALKTTRQKIKPI